MGGGVEVEYRWGGGVQVGRWSTGREVEYR